MKDPLYSLAAYPFVRLMLCSISGILLGYQSEYYIQSKWTLVCFALFFLLIPELAKRLLKHRFYFFSYATTITSYHLFIISAFSLITVFSEATDKRAKNEYLRSFAWEQISLQGRVEKSQITANGISLIVMVDSITIDGIEFRCGCLIHSSNIIPERKNRVKIS